MAPDSPWTGAELDAFFLLLPAGLVGGGDDGDGLAVGGFFFTFSEGLAVGWDVVAAGGVVVTTVTGWLLAASSSPSAPGRVWTEVGTLLLPAGVVEVVEVTTDTGWPLTASSSPSAPGMVWTDSVGTLLLPAGVSGGRWW